MKKIATLVFAVALVSGSAFAQRSKDLNVTHGKFPTNENAQAAQGVSNHAGGAGGSGNLIDHGGEVLTNAKVVYIFWGWPSTAATADAYVNNIIAFRDSSYAMMAHIGMLSQYRSTGSSSLKGTQPDVFDSTPPPSAKVTDSMVQAKVATECAKLSGGCRTDTIYEVFIPLNYYSDDGTGSQSCGGTNLAYCAYHGNGDGSNLSASVKYSIQPYPSCSGCAGPSSWTAYHNQEHFIVHETREAMTDARLNAWWDRAGYEADDKCAWGRNGSFLFQESAADGRTYAYQMEYSNQKKACVK